MRHRRPRHGLQLPRLRRDELLEILRQPGPAQILRRPPVQQAAALLRSDDSAGARGSDTTRQNRPILHTHFRKHSEQFQPLAPSTPADSEYANPTPTRPHV